MDRTLAVIELSSVGHGIAPLEEGVSSHGVNSRRTVSIGEEEFRDTSEAGVESALDSLAAHLAAHVDLDRILSIARSRGQ